LDYFLMSSYPEDPQRRTNQPIHPLDRRPEPATPVPNLPSVEPNYPKRQLAIPQTSPIFTYVILGVNILIFILDYLLDGSLTALGAKYNPAIIAGQFWRFITPMFLHALPPTINQITQNPTLVRYVPVALLHIVLNSYFLYIYGPQVERAFGHMRFLVIYFLSGFAASIASFALNPESYSVGASGALFGLFGSLLPLLYRNRNVLAGANQRIGRLVQVMIINLVIGFSTTFIDNWAHIGGLLAGLVLAWLTTPRYVVRRALTGEAERIDDETSPATALVWFGIVGLILFGIAFALIQMRSS
jgi:rhomboid protease GluP